MYDKGFTLPAECPQSLDQQALQLSFQLLRPQYPALALRVRNSVAKAGVPSKIVHEAVAALSSLSKHEDEQASNPHLLLVRKLLLVWMEYEVAKPGANGL